MSGAYTSKSALPLRCEATEVLPMPNVYSWFARLELCRYSDYSHLPRDIMTLKNWSRRREYSSAHNRYG